MRKTSFGAWLATFIVCYAFWMLLTWSVNVQELIAGALVSAGVALFTARFFIHERPFWFFQPVRLLRALGFYLGTFMAELVKANWDMAKRCYGGCKDIDPGIVKIPAGLRSDYGLASLANCITRTPGTITLEVTEEDGQNYFYVHWIDAALPGGEEAGEIIKGRMEKGLRRIWE